MSLSLPLEAGSQGGRRTGVTLAARRRGRSGRNVLRPYLPVGRRLATIVARCHEKRAKLECHLFSMGWHFEEVYFTHPKSRTAAPQVGIGRGSDRSAEEKAPDRQSQAATVAFEVQI